MLVSNWDPSKDFTAFGVWEYDYTNQREFFHAIEDQGFRRVNASYILLFQSKTGYRIEDDGHRKTCNEFPLNIKMNQFCIEPPAALLNSGTVGGTLNVNVYEYIAQSGDRAFISIAENAAAKVCIPVKIDGVFRDRNIDQEEYFDYVARVNPDRFVPPTNCSKSAPKIHRHLIRK